MSRADALVQRGMQLSLKAGAPRRVLRAKHTMYRKLWTTSQLLMPSYPLAVSGLQGSGDKPGNKSKSCPFNCLYQLPSHVDEDDPGNYRIGGVVLFWHGRRGRERSGRFPVQPARHEGMVNSRYQENVGSDDEEEHGVRHVVHSFFGAATPGWERLTMTLSSWRKRWDGG